MRRAYICNLAVVCDIVGLTAANIYLSGMLNEGANLNDYSIGSFRVTTLYTERFSFTVTGHNFPICAECMLYCVDRKTAFTRLICEGWKSAGSRHDACVTRSCAAFFFNRYTIAL